MPDTSEDAVDDASEADPDGAWTGEGANTDETGDPPAGGSDADGNAGSDDEGGDEDLAALRQEVESEYDFDDFGPNEMAEMSADEWEAAFDPDTWITGEELLDRVEADLTNKVASRDVFARVERLDDLLVAYSESGYAAVYPDGSVEGRGTVLRDVKPIVALCSMDSYEVSDAPAEDALPDPREIPASSDTLGNTVLQIVAAVQVVAGLVLFGALLLHATGVYSIPGGGAGTLNLWLLAAAGTGFLVIGLLLFVLVANARLSDKYRAEEFRNRLRGVGLANGERPEFLADIDGYDAPVETDPAEPGQDDETQPDDDGLQEVDDGSPGERSETRSA